VPALERLTDPSLLKGRRNRLPLLGGEGWGEGELIFNCIVTAKVATICGSVFDLRCDRLSPGVDQRIFERPLLTRTWVGHNDY